MIDPLAFAPDHPVLHAHALWHPDAPRSGPVTLLFERRLDFDAPLAPGHLWISACQRFIIELDGRTIARGPSRSDPDRWNVARVDIPALEAGSHTLTAVVWHLGEYAGKGQLGGRGFFLCTSEDEPWRRLVAEGWRTAVDPRRGLCTERAGAARGHTAVGAGEHFVASSTQRFAWVEPKVICRGAANPWGNRPLDHHLQPDPLPPMRQQPTHWRSLRTGDAPDGWLGGDIPLRLEPGRTHTLLLDHGVLTNAYVQLRWRGPGAGRIEIVTCEAPLDEATGLKGDRDDLAGKSLPGMLDQIDIMPAADDDPAEHNAGQQWRSLWFRCFRSMQLTVTVTRGVLDLFAPTLEATSYPLDSQAALTCEGAALGRVWPTMLDFGRRTAALCSHETFFDCPHYEQAQFPGDARIQARYHYLIANDDRLPRKAIDDLHASRTSCGLLRSHYPATMHQVISTYSLQWIGMLHDLLRYRGCADWLRRYMPAARGIAQWFLDSRRSDGLVGRCSAPFVDWCAAFTAGNAPQEDDGGSMIVTAMLAEACLWLARLEQTSGRAAWADAWLHDHEQLARDIRSRCFDASRGLFADTPRMASFSEHAQVQAILAGVTSPSEGRAILHRIAAPGLNDDSDDADADAVARVSTLYYRAHKAEAMRRCGLGAEVASLFDAWTCLLHGTGLTTWPERNAESRSDCHGWSVTPEVEFIHSILGLSLSDHAVGFDRVNFAPNLGDLASARGRWMTPAGPFEVELARDDEQIIATLASPSPLLFRGEAFGPGEHRFEWPIPSKDGEA